MAGMEGTVETPFGHVQKKTAVLIGAAFVLVLGVGWYRSKKNAAATAAASAGANTQIDPATGYAFGSPEDAAALSAQTSYVSPGSGGGNIPSGGPGGPGTFTNNAAWTQYVIQQIGGSDSSALQAALGVYLAGEPATDAQQSLIHQATAVGGLPPIAGPTGFPPAINTSPTPDTPPTGTNAYADNAAWLNAALAWANSHPIGATPIVIQKSLTDYLAGNKLVDWEQWTVTTIITGKNQLGKDFGKGIGYPPNPPAVSF